MRWIVYTFLPCINTKNMGNGNGNGEHPNKKLLQNAKMCKKQAKIRTYQNLTISPIYHRKGEQLGNGGKNMDTQKDKKLKPCPFCGGPARISADTEAVRDPQGRLWAFTVVCDSCCATSGLTYSPNRAIEAWNRRA